MNGWMWVLVAAAIAYLTKLIGYLVPDRVVENPSMTRMTRALTIGLLASLVVMNTFSSGTALVLDARLVALGMAVVALLARVPFLGVVILGAVGAAAARALGLP